MLAIFGRVSPRFCQAASTVIRRARTSGERHSETSDEVAGLKRVERISGKFYRRFTLPETADAEGITAKSNNGILEITIPKQPEVQSRRITVEAA